MRASLINPLAPMQRAVTVPTGTTYGVNVESHASANTKGSWTELVSATPWAADYFWLHLIGASTSVKHYLGDVAIGALGSEQTVLHNLKYVAGDDSASDAVLYPCYIGLPAAVRLSARVQCSTNSGGPDLGFEVCLFKTSQSGPYRFGRSDTYGTDTATSRCEEVDPGGSANTKGSYTEITSGLSVATRYVILRFGLTNPSLPSFFSWKWDLAIGALASEQIVVPDFHFRSAVSANVGDAIWPPLWGFPLNLAAAARLSLRAMCTGTDSSDRTFDVQAVTFT